MNQKIKKGCALLLTLVMTLTGMDFYGITVGQSVEAAEPSGQIQFYDIGSGKSVLVSDSGTQGYQVLSETGQYQVDGKNIALYKRGDADKTQDGKLTSKDLVASKKATTDSITTVNQKASDVNGDGKVDSKDHAFLRKSLVNDYDIMTTTKSESFLGQSVMPILGYYGPTDEEAYTKVKELGINAVVVNAADISNDKAKAKKILKAAEDNGIAVYLNDSSATDPDAQAPITNKEKLATANADYDAYASFAGYYLSNGAYILKKGTSESGSIHADDGVAQYKDTLASIAPYQNVTAYYNLLPYNSKELAYSLTGKETENVLDMETYKEYVRSVVNAGADYLSNDLLLRSDNSATLNTAEFYKNLDYLSTISRDDEIGTAFHGMVQVGSYYQTVNTKDSTTNLPTKEEMYLQASASLAFGAKGIRYNVLAQPKAYAENIDNDYDPYDYSRSGLLSYNGELNTTYANAAKKINSYVQAVDDVLMHAESQGVITTDQTVSSAVSESRLDSYGKLSGVTGHTALVGCFTYLTGDVYVIANTSLSDTVTVTMNFTEKVSGTLTAFDGSVSNQNGKCIEVFLQAGECAMLVLGEHAEISQTPVVQKTGMDVAVEDAANLRNTVQAYYIDAKRTGYTIENPQMKLTHGAKTLASLTTADGKSYLGANSIKNYVIDTSGTYYWSEASSTDMRVNTTKLGYYYYETKLQNLDFGSAVSGLYLEKSYHTYADKVNEVVRLITTSDYTSNIKTAGYLITIPKQTVEKTMIDGASLESISSGTTVKDYIGFDISGVGVLGFIVTGQSTSCVVTADENGYYLWQSKDASFTSHDEDAAGATGEMSIGNRIYTDTAHTFDGLKQVAYEEAHPIADKIQVTSGNTRKEVVYDYLSGNYQFDIEGLNLGAAYENPTAKPNVRVNINGVTDKRRIWLHAHTDKDLEAAVLIDGAKQIPIAMQTSKNFANDNVISIYEPDASTWGDSYMPLLVNENETYQFFIAHLYQNWGNYPLKQLSSIEYYSSYYHLSTGVTETTCIAPYYSTGSEFEHDAAWFMPDFRGMSSDTQSSSGIQKQSGAAVYAPGAVTTNEKAPATKEQSAQYLSSDIASSGMTYADVTMQYQSPDDNYSYTMRQVEQPQTDETRVYYQITFRFDEETTLSADNFQLLGVDSRVGKYRKMSYMNSSKSMKDVTLYEWKLISEPYDNSKYTLAEGTSYFACYNNTEGQETGNVGIIIRDDGGKQLAVQTKKSKTVVEGKDTTYCALTFNTPQTFQAGDTYTVEVVLLPFGTKSQTDYTSATNVYNDTVSNKLHTTAVCGTVIEDVIPTVASVDNKAEFTVSGGTSDATSKNGVNYTMRVTGFDSNVLPIVYEKVGNDWIEYKYSGTEEENVSWEGHTVSYDEVTDTYSYTFVFTKGAEDRTFRVEKGMDATVRYYLNGMQVYAKTYGAGEGTVAPTAADLGVDGQLIAGYYTDIAQTVTYTHGAPLSSDMNVYVNVADEMNITPTKLMESGILSKDGATKIMQDDGSVKVTGPNDTHTQLKKLNVRINQTSTFYMKLKVTDVTNVRMFALGTFTLDGTLTDTSEDNFGETKAYADGVKVKDAEDDYAIYQFIFHQWTGSGNSNELYFTKVTALSVSFWTASTGSLQIQSIYTEPGTVTGNVTVKYQIGAHEITSTLKAGTKVPYPTDLAQNSYTYGRKILGYYADTEFTKKYDFHNWVYQDTTIYVKLSDTFYLDPSLVTMTATDSTVFATNNFAATSNADENIEITGSASSDSWWQVTFSDIWTNVSANEDMLMKVGGTNSGKYLRARVWGTDRATASKKGWPGYTIYGTLVGTDTDGYSIYQFDQNPQLNNLSVIHGIRLDVMGTATEDAPIELAYIRAVKSTAVPVDVNYYVGDKLVYTQKVTPGDRAVKPTAQELTITDKKVCGFYTSTSFDTPYTFDAAVDKTTNIYVQTKDYLNLTNNYWAAGHLGVKNGEFIGNSDGTFTYTKTTDGESYLNRNGLDVALKEGQKIKLVAKVDGFTRLMAYPFGTYIEDGETTTIGGATGGYNWWFEAVDTTEDGYTVYELALRTPNDSKHSVEFETLTGIRIDLVGGSIGNTFRIKQLYSE